MGMRSYLQRLLPSHKQLRQAPRPKRKPRQLLLEHLEDRTVPAILFEQGIGLTVSDHDPGQPRGPVLTNPQVELVFWGGAWTTGANPTLRTNVTNAVDSMLRSPYTDRLAQYGIGTGVLAGAVTITSSSPGANFVNANVRTMLTNNINNGSIAYNSNLLYMVITQPGSTDPTEGTNGLVGEHAVGSASGGRSFYYGWTENVGGAGALDDITSVFSHEYAEAVTDPGGTAFQVDPRNQTDSQGNVTWNEIGDGNAQNHTFRVDNSLVQSYFSLEDHAFVVPNGSTNNFLVSSTGMLTFQEFVGGNNTIEISRVGNGVYAELNGSTAQFEPGAIHGIIVNALAGDQIFIDKTGADAPVTVNLGGGSEQVSIGFAGANLANIQGSISVQGGTGSDTLSFFDRSASGNLAYTVRDFTVTRLGVAPIAFASQANYNVFLYGSGGNNLYTVNGTAGSMTLNTGTGTDTVDVNYTSPGAPLVVNLEGNVRHTVNISPTARNITSIQASVRVNGGAGNHVLNVDDQEGSSPLTYELTSNSVSRDFAAAITFSGIAEVNVNGGTGNSIYNITGTGGSTTLNTGPGTDTVNVNNTSPAAPLVVNVGGTGSSTVNISPVAKNITNIQASVQVNGGTGDFTLNVDDQEGSSPLTYTLTSNSVSRDFAFPIGYSGINQVNVYGGQGDSTYNILSTGHSMALDTGPGTDTVNVQVTAGATITGGGGTDTLKGPTQTVAYSSAWHITGTNAGLLNNVAFSGFQNLTGASGNDNFIFADGAGVSGNISDSGGGANMLDYSAYSTPVTVDLSANSATGVGGSVMNILGLRGGAGDDSLTGNAAGTTFFIASPGNDTITGLETGNFLFSADGNGTANSTWNVTAQNSGTLTFSGAVTTFSGVQNLTAGGSGAATFVFADGAGVDGNIQGGAQGGINTLNYAAYSTTVVVDLQTHTATGVGGSVLNFFKNVVGGTGGGAGIYNILIGNGGNVLTGGDGRSNLLIAGASASTMIGGNGDDILIGGKTAYDIEADLASLKAIMDYWSTTADDYATRVTNLTGGIDVPLLDASKVTNNGGGNTMTGNNGGVGEHNLFYGLDPTMETTDRNSAIGEQFINC